MKIPLVFVSFLSTTRGWLLRKLLTVSSYVLTPFYAWLEMHGQGDKVTTIAVGIAALISALGELVLSWLIHMLSSQNK